MVTYIRLLTVQQQADEAAAERFRELWEDNDLEGLPPLLRSLPIKVWALLKGGPLTVNEIAGRLNCSVKSAYVSVYRLREEGQNIASRRDGRGPGKFCLLDGPPLRIVESREGIRLARANARRCANEVVIELK